MARIARTVASGFPHHVTQRGNRRQQTIFNKDGVVTYGSVGLVTQPKNWEWSSADLHIHGKDNLLLKSKPLIEMVNKPWKEFLSFDVQKPEIEQFKKT